MKSDFYNTIKSVFADGVKMSAISKVCYAPEKKSARITKEGFSVKESSFVILATTSSGKSTLASVVSDGVSINKIKFLFGSMNKNRATVAVYAIAESMGIQSSVSPEIAEKADETISVLENGVKEYADKFENNHEFRQKEIGKMKKAENERHEKRMKKLNEM